MSRILKSKIVLSFIVLTIITAGLIFAADVTVKQGTMYIDTDLEVDGDGDINGRLDVGSGPRLEIPTSGDDIWIKGGSDSINTTGDVEMGGGYLAVEEDMGSDESVFAYDVLYSNGYVVSGDGIATMGSLEVAGKIYSQGGYDPPYVLYDRQSRDEVVDRIIKEVPPDKQGGAALFFNKETNKLETYVASEGKFYDMQGKMIHQLPAAAKSDIKYQSFFLFDNLTGENIEIKEPALDRYKVKKGYMFNNKTGDFINILSKAAVPKEEALEIYSESEGKFYDLKRNFLRDEIKPHPIKYVKEEYRFNSLTGEVIKKHIPLKSRYVIKKGYKFNQDTGQFIDLETQQAVTKETAIEFREYTIDEN